MPGATEPDGREFSPAMRIVSAASTPDAARPVLRESGAVLLVSCCELGHQPLGIAWPQAFLERALQRSGSRRRAVLDPELGADVLHVLFHGASAHAR